MSEIRWLRIQVRAKLLCASTFLMIKVMMFPVASWSATVHPLPHSIQIKYYVCLVNHFLGRAATHYTA